jgi:hypothetical protein
LELHDYKDHLNGIICSYLHWALRVFRNLFLASCMSWCFVFMFLLHLHSLLISC